MNRFFYRLASFTLFITILLASLPVSNVSAAKKKKAWPEAPALYGEAACLIDASTGAVLFGQKEHQKMYPASITKILTALVTLENAGLNDDVTFSEECVNSLSYDDANMGMSAGEILPLEDCLYGMMLYSANEVATALAEHVAGSVDKFAQMMNERAAEAGATDSHFTNANGLHDDNHYITAYDMAMITRAAIANPVFLTISGTTEYTISKSNKKDAFTVYNRHKMLYPSSSYYYEGILGGKTGFTDQSGTTLVTYAERDGMTLISVVLNSNGYNVYNDTKLLLDYGFDNFKQLSAADSDTRFNDNSTDYTDYLEPIFNDNSSTDLYIDSSAKITIPNNLSFKDLTSEISYDKNGTTNDSGEYIVATINYSYNGTSLGSADILLKNLDISQDEANVSTDENVNGTDQADESSEVDSSSGFFAGILSAVKGFFTGKIFTAIVIILVILAVIFAVILYIRKKLRELNEIREQKRKRYRSYKNARSYDDYDSESSYDDYDSE